MIRGRVNKMSNIRTFKRRDGDGKVFNIVILDATSAIQVTFFNKMVDKFHDLIKLKHCYSFTNLEVKIANKNFNTTNNKFELGVHDRSEIKKMQDQKDIPLFNFNFVLIKDVLDLPVYKTIDVIAIVDSIEDTQPITTRAGKELFKRTI